MSKIIQCCYRICNRKKAKSSKEALHIESKKDNSVQLHHDEKTRKALSGGALEEYKEAVEDTTAEIIDTPILKHETVKTIIVDKKQVVYFHDRKSELEATEDKLIGILKCKVQPADVKPPLLIAQEQAVEIKHKPTESQNEQISRDNLLLKTVGQDAETQLHQTGKIASVISTNSTQDPDNLLGEKERTPVEQIKAMKTTSSKSPDNTLSEQRICYRKASAKRGFLNNSTREGKWWGESEAKNYRFTGHKVPGEQIILVQSPPELLQITKNIQHDVSPEMLNFSEIVPDVYLNSHLLEAFQDAFQFFRKDKTNRADLNDLQFSLSTMGLYLTHQDAFEALKSADIDGDGKVSFSDFLAVLTDNQRFLITIERKLLLPVFEQEYLDTVLFDAISRMLQKSCLPARSTAEIAKYYQEKFEAIPQFSKKKRSKSHVKVNLARDARIMGMTDKQLVHYLKEIKTNKGSCASSPYGVIPVVPLSSRKEKKLSGPPQLHRLMQKTIYKRHKEISDVDMQTDVRGRKHRGIQVDIYIPGCKHKTNLIPIDRRLPTNKIQKLDMSDHDLDRHQVDLGKKCFLERAVRRKQSTTLHLWDRIQGEQIEQETRNPMFSTYSWSWDTHHELLERKKLYQRKTKKQWETASAPLGPGIPQSHMDTNAEHRIWEKSDERRTDILSKLSPDFLENLNVIEKPEKKRRTRMNKPPSCVPTA
ncbi:EF-hand calcium-binding domain-containing protein 3 [Dendrobates tinctorius]|uniref:EF-hand calcium-binding domain-containing protein 3 n=1 Tax=Dendrobates tinctorius TaxID=92724 RepID=UPI003CC9B24C